jgi:hypothetical protein
MDANGRYKEAAAQAIFPEHITGWIIPTVCSAALQVNRSENLEELANHTKIHGYINGDMAKRMEYMKTIKGFPIVKIKEGKGEALISTMVHEKSLTDPIAARLLTNMINATLN